LGSIFLLDAGSPVPAIEQTAATLAMHAAAMKPSFLEIADLDEKTKSTTVEEAQAKAIANMKEGMPEKARQNVLKGVEAKALQQLYRRDVLLE
jgi:translation elongation factor EF-Ts